MPLLLSIFFSVFFLDWGTKAVVRAKLLLEQEIPVTPFFSWVHVQNTGIAFGLFPNQNIIFIVIGIGMTSFLLYVVRQMMREDRFSALVIAAVLGGAWGNLLDRIAYGAVTDFLDFHWGIHHWPAFNVADSAICVGATLLVLRNLSKGRQKRA